MRALTLASYTTLLSGRISKHQADKRGITGSVTLIVRVAP